MKLVVLTLLVAVVAAQTVHPQVSQRQSHGPVHSGKNVNQQRSDAPRPNAQRAQSSRREHLARFMHLKWRNVLQNIMELAMVHNGPGSPIGQTLGNPIGPGMNPGPMELAQMNPNLEVNPGKMVPDEMNPINPGQMSAGLLTPPIPDLDPNCQYIPDTGACFLENGQEQPPVLMRYYYDVITRSCYSFSYSGCMGNPNNFASQEECEAKCTVAQPSQPGPDGKPAMPFDVNTLTAADKETLRAMMSQRNALLQPQHSIGTPSAPKQPADASPKNTVPFPSIMSMGNPPKDTSGPTSPDASMKILVTPLNQNVQPLEAMPMPPLPLYKQPMPRPSYHEVMGNADKVLLKKLIEQAMRNRMGLPPQPSDIRLRPNIIPVPLGMAPPESVTVTTQEGRSQPFIEIRAVPMVPYRNGMIGMLLRGPHQIREPFYGPHQSHEPFPPHGVVPHSHGPHPPRGSVPRTHGPPFPSHGAIPHTLGSPYRGAVPHTHRPPFSYRGAEPHGPPFPYRGAEPHTHGPPFPYRGAEPHGPPFPYRGAEPHRRGPFPPHGPVPPMETVDFPGFPVNMPRACMLPRKIGRCRGSIRRWYFDINTGICKKFGYGGCGGNRNRFPSKEECEGHCLSPMMRTRRPKVDVEEVGIKMVAKTPKVKSKNSLLLLRSKLVQIDNTKDEKPKKVESAAPSKTEEAKPSVSVVKSLKKEETIAQLSGKNTLHANRHTDPVNVEYMRRHEQMEYGTIIAIICIVGIIGIFVVTLIFVRMYRKAKTPNKKGKALEAVLRAHLFNDLPKLVMTGALPLKNDSKEPAGVHEKPVVYDI